MCAMQGDNLYYFYDGLWYDLTRARTRDMIMIDWLIHYSAFAESKAM